ncbi:glycosyltransferase family 4 protein [Falsirhodobacter algicola]|uniref:Glycosyltransferase n=1 Tax=Falsirhodobacter algicola TaxID=2692330 RepID=A0A8J8SK38_9RHOB|nr:glycosyltransferase family 4 protein [Falsirhodobacter algicola]QUS35111.1 glycosyltransferase [Falsirhodobacter algicola]
MRLLVFAHRLELGGTQTNAIELAAALRDRHDFEVLFHATPGPMEDLVHAKGLRFLPAADARLHPSLSRIRLLRDVVRRERPDLIHAWDWWQGIEAYCGVHLPMNVPLIISDMMMSLTRLLPRQIPTTFGFEALQQQAEREGWRAASLLPPPVDLHANRPGRPARAEARAALGIEEGEIAIVSVSRLAHVMKSESLIRAIDAMRRLAPRLPLKLVIVGDGMARAELQQRAASVNEAVGRPAIVLTGGMTDPRPAYEAADIVLGMGGSALRGMAYAKPVVITGAQGFARIFAPDSAHLFQQNGMYGVGGTPEATATALLHLATDPDLRTRLGAFGRSYVEQHHALDMLADRFAALCHAAVDGCPAQPSLQDAARSAMIYLRERRFRNASRDRTIAPRP